MRLGPLILVLAVVSGCSNEPPTGSAPKPNAGAATESRNDRTNDFFVEWLESHGHTDVVVDSGGVGVRSNATRLRASIYGSKKYDDGGFVVEMEFTIQLPSKRQITEFVAGAGDTEEQAINDCMLNFTLTTFHVVYGAFINAADPHTIVKKVEINGQNRDVIMGDLYLRGSADSENIDLSAMRPRLQDALSDSRLTPEAHWIKIVYGQMEGKPITVSATLDNEEHQALTDLVTQLPWPRSEGFYMVKQFIVIK